MSAGAASIALLHIISAITDAKIKNSGEYSLCQFRVEAGRHSSNDYLRQLALVDWQILIFDGQRQHGHRGAVNGAVTFFATPPGPPTVWQSASGCDRPHRIVVDFFNQLRPFDG